MPKPATRLENPFDDVHASNTSAEPNGLGSGDSAQAGSTSYATRSQRDENDDDDDDDTPEQPRRYRF